MILPDVEPVLRLDALVSDARPHHLREAVDVDRVHVERLLDLGPHGVRPRLRPEDADLERGLARVEALRPELVENGEHVGRRHHDDVGLEVLDQLDLSLGHAAGDRDRGAAEPLRAVMGAEAAGEEAVAVGDMHLHAGPAARGANRARHQVRPDVDIARRVADDRRLAGGAGGGVDAHDLLARHREHAERVVLAQILLRGEGEFPKVRQLLEILRVDAPAASNFFR